MKDRVDSPDQMMTVLWWIPAGHVPTVGEAKERLEQLIKNGSGPHAFTFREAWPKPEIITETVQKIKVIFPYESLYRIC
ncbi:hypothetical protein BH09BAC4_BH09BAC4_47940 [soil metagenome]